MDFVLDAPELDFRPLHACVVVKKLFLGINPCILLTAFDKLDHFLRKHLILKLCRLATINCQNVEILGAVRNRRQIFFKILSKFDEII